MYAVIKTGGKQYRVSSGDVIEVEHLRASGGDTLSLIPVLVVTDDGRTIHGKDALAEYPVGAKIVGETKGEKVQVFKFKNKTGYSRKTGHRQLYSMIEITSIGKSEGTKAPAKSKAKRAPATESAPGETAGAESTKTQTDTESSDGT